MQPEELNRWNRKKKELEHLMRDIYRRRGRTHQSLRQKSEYSQSARSSLISLGRYEKEELKRAEAELAALQAQRRQAEEQEKRNRILRGSAGIILGLVLVLFLFSGVYYFATDFNATDTVLDADTVPDSAGPGDVLSTGGVGTNFLRMLWQSFSSSNQLSGATITEVSEAEGETKGETEGGAMVEGEQSSSAPETVMPPENFPELSGDAENAGTTATEDAVETLAPELPSKPPVEAHFAADEDAVVKVEENSSWELLGTTLQYAGEDIPQAIDFQPEIVVSSKNIADTSTPSSTPPGRVGTQSGVQPSISVQSASQSKKEIKITIPHQRQYRPGTYILSITSRENGIISTTEQAFSWGVLAINTEKSIYLPDENAFIGIGVLDDQGRMVCTANVVLEITAPNGKNEVLSTANSKIQVSPECEVYGVTNLPDYYTDYTVAGPGTYRMNLTATTPNGVRSLQDTFIVQDKVPFDVARHGPTRIYPLVPYTMNFTITASTEYQGQIHEYVPSSFAITPQDGMTISTEGDTTTLTWNVALKKSETTTLSYEFDAPDISPEFYVLGPLDIGSWQEVRSWQIASDQGQQFSIAMNDVDMFPINETAVLIAFVNRTAPQLDWMILNTTGSIKQSVQVVTPGSNITRVAVSPLNSTHFILGWINISAGDANFRIYRFDGTIFQDRVDVDTAVGSAFQDVSVVTTGEGNGNGNGKGGDRFFYCYADAFDNDALLAIYNYSSRSVGTASIDATMSPAISAMNYIDCAAINRTSIVYIENDVITGDISYAVINGSGTAKVATTAITGTAPGATSQVATTVVNTTWGNRFVLAWYNATGNDIVMQINNENNVAVFNNKEVESNAGSFSKVAIATVNNKSSEGDNFVLLWYNSTDEVIYAEVFNGSGTTLVNEFKVETQPSRHPSLMDAVGKIPVLNYSLQPGYFGVAYSTNTSNNTAVIKYFNSTDGREWGGNPPILPDTVNPSIPDVIPIQNTTYNASDTVMIAANVTDNIAVSRVFANISATNGTIKLLELIFRSDNRYNNTFNDTLLTGPYNLTFFANDSSGNENRAVTSNFSVQDQINPSIPDVLPLQNTTFNASDTVMIAANVTDNGNLSRVFANISATNGTIKLLELMFRSANLYNNTFNDTLLTGPYNLTFFANDSSGNENRTVTSNFSVQDRINPSVPDVIPIQNTTFNASDSIMIAANVTDNGNMSRVFANISATNGTMKILELMFRSDNRYNNTFNDTRLTGPYNLTFFANDSSGNENRTVTSNFTVQDRINPSIPDVLPLQNTTYNVGDSIGIFANVTDNGNLSRVFANISEPNGTIVLLELIFSSANRYNNTFTAPALTGSYNLTFFANDSSGNANRTVTSNFSVTDVVNPSVTTLLPAAKSIFNTSGTIEIAANVTDDVNVSHVYANITLPNGTISQLILSNRSDFISKFNNSFTIPSLNGFYNVSFFANDTSNNINFTQFTNFTAQLNCGTLTNSVTLEQDVDSSGTCFTIGHDDLTLDCAGYNITYATVGGSAIGVNNEQNNITIKHCEMDSGSSGSNQYGIFMGNVAVNGTLYNNTIVTGAAGSSGIFINGSSNQTNVTRNTITVSGASADGISLTDSNSQTINNNVITVSGSGDGINLIANASFSQFNSNNISISSSGSGININDTNSSQNTFFNTTISSTASAPYFTIDNRVGSTTGNNTLWYNNSFGLINWTKSNLTTNISLNVGTAIYLQNNRVGLADNAETLQLDAAATIRIYNLSYRSTPHLLKDGVRCDNTNACNISYVSAGGALFANISSFSNFSTNSPPNVTSIVPAVNSVFNLTNTIEIGANVTDDVSVNTVVANLSIPNGTVRHLTLSNKSGYDRFFNTSYTIAIPIGLYNITIWANDSNGAVNNSETSNFTVNDIVNPNVTTLLPAANSLFNTSNLIEIAANVTDDVGVNNVSANITYPNGTINRLYLSNKSGFPAKFNASFITPSLLNGVYNVSFFANDTSNNINNSQSTNFTAFPDCGLLTKNITLEQDIDSIDTCITIGASNIYLNCSGYIINYSGPSPLAGYGVDNTGGYADVVIQHCVIVENNVLGSTQNGSHGIRFSDASRGIIYNNTIITQGNSSAIYLTSSPNANITRNNLTTTTVLGTEAHGIRAISAERYAVAQNTISTSSNNSDGMVFSTSILDSNVSVNNITVSGKGKGIHLSGSTNTRNNFFNNTIHNNGGSYSILDRTSGNSTQYNYLRYNTSLSQVSWNLSNLSTNISLIPGVTIYLKNNSVGLTDNNQALNLNETINGTASIEIYSLPYASTPRLLKNNVRCDDTNACNTSYQSLVAGVGILRANLSSFSNYSTNSLPSAPVLLSPANNSTTTSRTPTFTWENSDDFNNPNLTYALEIDDNAAFNNLEVNNTGIAGGTTNTSYTITTQLAVDTLFYWRVKANDTETYGNYSQVFNFTVQSLLAVTLVTNTVAFGSQINEVRLTTSNKSLAGTVQPFELRNDGNVVANISINASALFTSVSFPSDSYQFRIEENETGSFNTTLSNMSYVNVSAISSLAIVFLNWVDVTDDVIVALNVTVPPAESIGAKSSTVTFSAEG